MVWLVGVCFKTGLRLINLPDTLNDATTSTLMVYDLNTDSGSELELQKMFVVLMIYVRML